jgi:hypothetical protein
VLRAKERIVALEGHLEELLATVLPEAAIIRTLPGGMGPCLAAEFLAEASSRVEGLRRQCPPAEGEEGQQGLEADLLPVVSVLLAHRQRGEQSLL